MAILLRYPRTVISQCRTAFRVAPGSSCHRSYHSYEVDFPPPFTDAENAILSAALAHVPSHGFTTTALSHGARDAGYLDVSTNLFTSGPFDLINYHLKIQRLALKNRVQFPDHQLGVGAKVRLLALQRLRANEPIIARWPEVICTTSQHDSLHFLPFILNKALINSSRAGLGRYGASLQSATFPTRTCPPFRRDLVLSWRYQCRY